MSAHEFVNPDARFTHPLARPLSEFQGYDRLELTDKAKMLGLTAEECQAIYFDLATVLTEPQNIRARTSLSTLAMKSHDAMEQLWRESGKQSTKAQHTDASGAYTSPRANLHRMIVRREMGRVPSVKESDTPNWLIIAGPTGSGKTSVSTDYQVRVRRAVLTDPDGVREDLLGVDATRDSINARMTHEEAGDISDMLFQTAREQRKPIISETTLRDLRWYDTAIAMAKESGYDVAIIYLFTQFPFCFGNALVRPNRPIPLHVLLSCTQGMRNVLEMGGRKDITSISIAETQTGEVVPLEKLVPSDPIRRKMQAHIDQFSGILS